MDKKDAFVLAGIIAVASVVLTITIMLGNGIMKNPFV